MTPEQIRKRLKKLNITQKAIAKRCHGGEGVSEMSVSKVIDKKIIADEVMTQVATALGVPKERVFPEYYLGPCRRRTSKASGPKLFAA